MELRAERSLVLTRASLVGDPGCASGDHGLEGSVRPLMGGRCLRVVLEASGLGSPDEGAVVDPERF